MKNGTLLNSEISYVIGKLGHKDQLAIGDAGLPIPSNVERIDLAVTKNIPDFLSVFKAVLSEQEVEMVIMADEIKEKNPGIHEEIIKTLKELENQKSKKIEEYYITHESFKTRLPSCRAVIRTGECSPYANIILVSGVAF